MTQQEELQEVSFLKEIIKGITSFPDEVDINQTVDDMGVLLSVRVNKEDMGKIIGKEGEIAKAMRRIMNAYGYLRKKKLNVKIFEPNK